MIEIFDLFIRTNITTDEEQISQIKKVFSFRQFNRHELILVADEVCSNFYFIAKGGVRIYFLTPNGQEKTRFITLDNSIITSLSSFITKQPSVEYLETIDVTQVFTVDYDGFFYLVNNSLAWERFYRKILETAYLVQTKRIEIRTTMSAKQRFEWLINENRNYCNVCQIEYLLHI
ncbi:MAG: cyclic nucleotide-binding domain-containing protein [Bacteroidales bacterium]|nr:cyclic nucleotide-binding domain-containing protein [Bacteroidales bacterium]